MRFRFCFGLFQLRSDHQGERVYHMRPWEFVKPERRGKLLEGEGRVFVGRFDLFSSLDIKLFQISLDSGMVFIFIH